MKPDKKSETASYKSQLGSFLEPNYWNEAVRLLTAQINSTDNHFKTPSIIYYRHLQDKEKAGTTSYFKDRVQNGLFYGLENEFFIREYQIPKTSLGLRDYKFFSYPMRLTYYSIVLYLVNLSAQFRSDFIDKNDRIRSFYGGNLYFEGNSLILGKKNINYRPHYQAFKEAIEKETFISTSNVLVMRFDLQNFFDTISISRLLEFLSQHIKPSSKKKENFDQLAIEQIGFFFEFINKSKLGIPQADNDICASFLGYLYLLFADLIIDDLLQKTFWVTKYKIIRYIDDYYIFLTFREDLKEREKDSAIHNFTAKLYDIFHLDFGLRIQNYKNNLSYMSNDEEKSTLLASIKKVSQGYQFYVPDTASPKLAADRLIKTLTEFDDLKINKNLCFSLDFNQKEALKAIYGPNVRSVLMSKNYKQKICDTFSEFNFELVKLYPKPIIVLICLFDDIKFEFTEFLLAKNEFTSLDIALYLEVLCQDDFKNDRLFNKLKQSSHISNILKDFENPFLQSEEPGYFSLAFNFIQERVNICQLEQIKYRVLNERQRSYSVALNHLCNELCAIIHNPECWTSEEVQNYLAEKRVSSITRIKIRNLFDRRNNNLVSHAGTMEAVPWTVTASEYFEYKQAIQELLTELFPEHLSFKPLEAVEDITEASSIKI